jgi:hypothetical protein
MRIMINFIENPVLYTKKDGTEVTNFHEGIAKWAATSDQLRGTSFLRVFS